MMQTINDWEAHAMAELSDILHAISTHQLSLAEAKNRINLLERELITYFSGEPSSEFEVSAEDLN